MFVSQQGYDNKVTDVIETYTNDKKLYHIGFDYEKDVRCRFLDCIYFVIWSLFDFVDYPCAKFDFIVLLINLE